MLLEAWPDKFACSSENVTAAPHHQRGKEGGGGHAHLPVEGSSGPGRGEFPAEKISVPASAMKKTKDIPFEETPLLLVSRGGGGDGRRSGGNHAFCSFEDKVNTCIPFLPPLFIARPVNMLPELGLSSKPHCGFKFA
jgi:hypothetical protein